MGLSYLLAPVPHIKDSHPMIDSRTAPYAATLLRISLGAMFIAHSLILKYLTFTLPGTAQFFESLGLPAGLAYATFFAELIGGVLLVAGVGTRSVALALIPILAGAAWVHSGNGWALLGDGRYALANRLRAPNLRLAKLCPEEAVS